MWFWAVVTDLPLQPFKLSPSSPSFRMLLQNDRSAELCAFKYSASRPVCALFHPSQASNIFTVTMLTKFFAFFALLSIVALAAPQGGVPQEYQGVTCRFLHASIASFL